MVGDALVAVYLNDSANREAFAAAFLLSPGYTVAQLTKVALALIKA